MGTINPSIPTIGQPNSTEDADVRSGLITIRDEINGNLDNDNIKNAANISGDKLADNSVAPSKLSNGTAGQLLIANASGVITSTTVSGDVTISSSGATSIGTGAVTTTKINDLAVTTGKINDLGVTTGKLADDAVTAAKLSDATDAEITATTKSQTDRAVTTDHIRDSAVTSAKIANGTIVAADIADSTIPKGKISYHSASGYLQTGVGMTNSMTSVMAANSVPAGTYMVTFSWMLVTGSSTTFNNYGYRITSGASTVVDAVIDPIVGTSANYDRNSYTFTFVTTLTTTASITLEMAAYNNTGGTPANCSVAEGSYSVLGLKTA